MYSAFIYILKKKKASYTWIYKQSLFMKKSFTSYTLYEGKEWEQHYINNTSSKLILCVPIKARETWKGSNQSSCAFWISEGTHQVMNGYYKHFCNF